MEIHDEAGRLTYSGPVALSSTLWAECNGKVKAYRSARDFFLSVDMGIAADHCEEMAVTAESSLDDLKRRGGRLQGEIVEVGPSGLDVGVRYVEQKIEEEYGSLRGAVWRAPGPFDPAAVAAVIASMAVRFEECEHEWLDRPESDTRECLVCGREDWQ